MYIHIYIYIYACVLVYTIRCLIIISKTSGTEGNNLVYLNFQFKLPKYRALLQFRRNIDRKVFSPRGRPMIPIIILTVESKPIYKEIAVANKGESSEFNT